jgi:hypothetical protein
MMRTVDLRVTEFQYFEFTTLLFMPEIPCRHNEWRNVE